MALSPLIWLATGLVIMGIEILVPGFVVFWFGAGAILTAVMVFFHIIPSDSAVLQWSFFFLSSLGFLALWHFYMKKHFRGKVNDDVRDPTITELRGRVTKAIVPGIPGQVELYSVFHGIKSWQAESDEVLDENEEIRVVESRGIRLLVAKLK